MTGFQLDTSGFVLRVGATKQHPENLIAWSDLSPFVQGYVEALFASANRFECKAECRAPCSDCLDEAGPQVGFSDLAPETLALILKDCERARKAGPDTRENGAAFWFVRQNYSEWVPEHPPLTPTLSDDGKVYLRQAQEAQS